MIARCFFYKILKKVFFFLLFKTKQQTKKFFLTRSLPQFLTIVGTPPEIRLNTLTAFLLLFLVWSANTKTKQKIEKFWLVWKFFLQMFFLKVFSFSFFLVFAAGINKVFSSCEEGCGFVCKCFALIYYMKLMRKRCQFFIWNKAIIIRKIGIFKKNSKNGNL